MIVRRLIVFAETAALLRLSEAFFWALVGVTERGGDECADEGGKAGSLSVARC